MACYAHSTPVSTVWTYSLLLPKCSTPLAVQSMTCGTRTLTLPFVSVTFSHVVAPNNTFIASVNKHVVALGFKWCLNIWSICLSYPTAGSWCLAVDAVEWIQVHWVFVEKKISWFPCLSFLFFSSLRLGLLSLGLVVLYPVMNIC